MQREAAPRGGEHRAMGHRKQDGFEQHVLSFLEDLQNCLQGTWEKNCQIFYSSIGWGQTVSQRLKNILNAGDTRAFGLYSLSPFYLYGSRFLQPICLYRDLIYGDILLFFLYSLDNSAYLLYFPCSLTYNRIFICVSTVHVWIRNSARQIPQGEIQRRDTEEVERNKGK